jgi:hypothetical protein
LHHDIPRTHSKEVFGIRSASSAGAPPSDGLLRRGRLPQFRVTPLNQHKTGNKKKLICVNGLQHKNRHNPQNNAVF